ncbi:NADH-quinone oxidoreductase subunit L [Actinomadura kijaniata]|uniref:NADH-quinone oxidoreductase subunit L n=1 Tax=Actinomadura namibiensis TaxID=182080 RepID=A0A7W3QNU3_ACTNM|nr:NADH-quinone oxidoreductase subunit L [Actinomadura namibiensis]MBA8953967.1 NADH-quinone oxidoreductase subunit L [Actinomadura namibiensis]
MIVLASLTILLPFLAAFAGFLLGPKLSEALRAGGATPAEPEPPEDPRAVVFEKVPGGGPRTGERVWRRAAVVAERTPLRNGPALAACLPMAAATVLAAIVAFTVWRSPGERAGTLTLVGTGSVPIRIGLQVDGLAAVVALMVCCVALAVQVYSVAYMAKDPRYSSYAAFISLFTAAMLLVVYAGDLLLLYVGWEVMGVCSYFLIGHHWENRENSRAAVKAFLVTRLGDVGFLFGIFLLGIEAGSFRISDVLQRVPLMPDATVTAAALLLLAGVAGKSAQFPLHTWLPDAMAGPTPISALIHAATMVAAGIYVVARLYGVFLTGSAALTVLGVLAVISMVGSALAALAQDDIKRVLAYSTISQLAVMAAGLAVGAKSAAIFHLLTHGAFKALLFLAAGSVIMVAGSNLLRHYGGLRRAMPLTFWSMTVGLAALVGIPPVSGWFSKDSIIEAAQHAALDGTGTNALVQELKKSVPPGTDFYVGVVETSGQSNWAAWLVYLGLLLTVALTAAYAARLWLMTFFGETRGEFEPREAPKIMAWTVAALAVPSAVLGFFGLGAAELRPHLGTALLVLLLAALGAGGAFLLWNRDPAADPASRLGPLRPVFANAFHVDTLYNAVVVRPVRVLARLVVRADDRGIDAAVLGTGHAARRLGGLLRIPQNGNPQTYLTGVLAGVVVIAAVVVISL